MRALYARPFWQTTERRRRRHRGDRPRMRLIEQRRPIRLYIHETPRKSDSRRILQSLMTEYIILGGADLYIIYNDDVYYM